MGVENPRQRRQRIEAWQSEGRPFAAPHGSAASSNYCYRPAQIRPGMSGRDLLKIAHGGEEIGPHEYVSGKCKYCGQQEPQNAEVSGGRQPPMTHDKHDVA